MCFSLCGRLSGLEYALRLDVANALAIPLSAVLVDSLCAVAGGRTEVTHADSPSLSSIKAEQVFLLPICDGWMSKSQTDWPLNINLCKTKTAC